MRSQVLATAVFFFGVSAAAVGADNVDVAAPQADRVAHMHRLVTWTVNDLDHQRSAAYRSTTILFLMRVAWHEGAFLRERRQLGGGPGRSFFQFEPGKAKDGVDYADSHSYRDIVPERDYIVGLATAGGSTRARVTGAAAPLMLGDPWPAGNLIEELLGNEDKAVDLFACYLARIALYRVAAAIPADLDGQAEYWADHWKVVFPDGDRAAKIMQFKANAMTLDGLLP